MNKLSEEYCCGPEPLCDEGIKTKCRLAQLEAEIAIQHKYQANMMDEDAQPLPEWIAYFDELEALESGGE